MCMMNKRKSQMDHTIEHIRHRNPSVGRKPEAV